jgi:hypothetical protein
VTAIGCSDDGSTGANWGSLVLDVGASGKDVIDGSDGSASVISGK